MLNLDARYYVDPAVYERERVELFAKTWQLMGPVSQLGQRGDYCAAEIAGHKVFAIRGRDGKLRAFRNLCRHRGARLLPEGNGRCPTIRCPYHQWVWADDGRLLAVAVDPNGVGGGFFTQQRQGEAQLWDLATRRRVGQGITPGAGSVFSVAFSADGTLLATGSYLGQLDLWDVATQAHHGRPMRVADDGVLSVAFAPGGRLVAAGGATGPAWPCRMTWPPNRGRSA